MAIIDRTYEAAADEGKVKVILIPTQPILAPVNPVEVSSKFPFHEHLAVCTLADGLCEVYHTPSAENIRKYAKELETLADALDGTPLPSELPDKRLDELPPDMRRTAEGS
jgi:hypothetical protein